MNRTEDNKQIITLNSSNRITYEDLRDITGSFFINVYREADRTLCKILEDESKHTHRREDDRDEQGINIISFLGERGRGKTSAMLSFIFWLTKLQSTDEWSLTERNFAETFFLCFPYIDATMLAENEFIIDVVLAQMWDRFEELYKKKGHSMRETSFECMERNLKQQFMKVRRAYLTLKNKEKGEKEDGDMPMPGALHELAASINLREEFQKLIKSYIEIFSIYGTDGEKRNVYLVFAIDDVDMSTGSAYFILEQIRRFLRLPRVIIFITADIDRLHKACEINYSGIYSEADRAHLVDEYLEKVLPYNMRVYMPEIGERYDEILLRTDVLEKLKLHSRTEKKIILEFMVQKCGMYFDGKRKTRHFLQNRSMRSLVNYLEQMERMNALDCTEWTKTDLRERLIERLMDTRQKAFLKKMMYCDYQDINKRVLNYLIDNLKNYAGKPAKIYSIGQILYVCSLYEEQDTENIEFVNCIIMFYSIILNQIGAEFREQIVSGSALGEREYRGIMKDAEKTNLIAGFADLNYLSLDILKWTSTRKRNKADCLKGLLVQNRDEIIIWLYSMLYVQPWNITEQKIEFIYQIQSRFEKMEDENRVQNSDNQGEKEETNKKEIERWLQIRPVMTVRKEYFACLIKSEDEQKEYLKNLLDVCLQAIKNWVQEQECWRACDESRLNAVIKGAREDILKELKLTENVEPEVLPVQNVELMYSIGRRLDEIVLPEKIEERTAYDLLVAKYAVIQNSMRECREFYCSIREEEKFAENFEHRLQVRLLLEPGFWADNDLREKFKSRLIRILIGLRSMTKFSATIAEPQV